MLADAVPRPVLDPEPFVSSHIDPKRDHAGEGSLDVTVHVQPDSRVADGLIMLAGSVALQEALARQGAARRRHLAVDLPVARTP